MPQSSYAYAVARIRGLETRMIDAARMNRLIEAGHDEAVRLLSEMGYGGGVSAGGDVERLINGELAAVRKDVWEITPDPDVTGLFLLRYDAHNLKALLKGRLLGTDVEGLLEEGGVFPIETLQKAVSERDYSELPEQFRQELDAAEQQLLRQTDPGALSACVDRAVFAYITAVLKKSKQKFALEYFQAQADFINVLSVVRARALSYNEEQLKKQLVRGGEISEKDLVEGLSLTPDQLPKKYGFGSRYASAIGKALEEYVATGSTQGFERRLTGARIALLKARKYEPFDLAPVVGYLVGREVEAGAIRTVFAAKQTGAEPALPELYE